MKFAIEDTRIQTKIKPSHNAKFVCMSRLFNVQCNERLSVDLYALVPYSMVISVAIECMQ